MISEDCTVRASLSLLLEENLIEEARNDEKGNKAEAMDLEMNVGNKKIPRLPPPRWCTYVNTCLVGISRPMCRKKRKESTTTSIITIRLSALSNKWMHADRVGGQKKVPKIKFGMFRDCQFFILLNA